MKKIVIVMFVLVAFVGSAFAADVIEMKKGVKFNHKAHQTAVGDCKKCHEKGPGKIEGFGKESPTAPERVERIPAGAGEPDAPVRRLDDANAFEVVDLRPQAPARRDRRQGHGVAELRELPPEIERPEERAPPDDVVIEHQDPERAGSALLRGAHRGKLNSRRVPRSARR